VYSAATAAVKMSILLQYRRVFAVPHIKWLTFFGLIIILTFACAMMLVFAFLCSPVAAFWDRSIPGYCLNPEPFWYTHSGFNIISDFFIFLMPFSLVKSLHVPPRRKALLFIVFGLGFL
jgi:hypothetical protein